MRSHKRSFAGLIAVILALITADTVAFAQSSAAALRAMERMSFTPKVGDAAEIVGRMVSKDRGKPSPFRVVIAYKVEAAEPGGGFRVALAVRSAGMDGISPPAGFDSFVQAIMPPVQLRTNGELRVLEA